MRFRHAKTLLLALVCAITTATVSTAHAQVVPVSVRFRDCSSPQYCRQYVDRGTGFVIQRDDNTAVILTAAHVLRMASKGSATIFDDVPIEIILRDDRIDVALVLARWSNKSDTLRIADEVRIGSQVEICGLGGGQYRQAVGKLTSETTVSAIARDGDSGGPVIDSRGLCVGIAIAVSRSDTRIVSAAQLRAFIAPYVTTTTPAQQSPVAPQSPKLPSGGCGCLAEIAGTKRRIEELEAELRKQASLNSSLLSEINAIKATETKLILTRGDKPVEGMKFEFGQPIVLDMDFFNVKK